MRIHRTVVTVVNSTNNHTRPSRTKLGQRHLDTINRRTITRPHLYPITFVAKCQRQRNTSRKSTCHATTGTIWCTDQNVTVVFHHVYQAVDAFGFIAVIVRYQYQGIHPYSCAIISKIFCKGTNKIQNKTANYSKMFKILGKRAVFGGKFVPLQSIIYF